MSTFRKIVANHPRECEELPLFHTSQCESMKSISSSHSLQPKNCKVFKESLIYFFYGRPAYRSPNGTYYDDPVPLCPICLVFKPQTVSKSVRRVFPCDSGAVNNNRFKPNINSGDLADLALNPHIDSARRLVSLLFENNGNYFLGKIAMTGSFSAGSIEERYRQLLSVPKTEYFDDRRSAIEIQVNKTINLIGHLLYVVLPREFLEHGNIRETIINVWKCVPIAYPTFKGTSPDEYYPVVRNNVFDKYRNANQI